jgi:hypothetical protein
MDSLKEKIVEKLQSVPESALQEVLDFIDFVVWRKMTREEPYNWQSGEIDEDCLVEYVGGVLVVQAASRQAEGQENWMTAVHDLREERLKKLTSW